MSKSPFWNATLAAGYIVLITLLIFLFSSHIQEKNGFPDLIIPMVMLSLFVFSAAVMSYLFVYEPLRLHLENKQQEAVAFFLKTLLSFAFYVLIFISIMFFTL